MDCAKLITPGNIGCWLQMERLYRKSFPREERKPFVYIYRMHRAGKNAVYCLCRGKKVLGFASLVLSDSTVLLDYLAVDTGCRGQGTGKRILKELMQIYDGRGLVVEIEAVTPSAPDYEQRLRRRRFYESCGFSAMDVRAEVFGVDMELMGWQCCLSFDQYRQFYHDHNSPWAAEHVKPASGY